MSFSEAVPLVRQGYLRFSFLSFFIFLFIFLTLDCPFACALLHAVIVRLYDTIHPPHNDSPLVGFPFQFFPPLQVAVENYLGDAYQIS